MPYHLTTELDYLWIVFFDVVTPQDLQSLADEIGDIEGTLSILPHRLIDLSQVSDMALTYPDMLALTERRRGETLANPVKSALVASQPLSVGFARMFQTLNDHPQIAIQIFPSLEAAQAWLAVL